MSFIKKLFGKSETTEPTAAPPPPSPEPAPIRVTEISPADLKARLDNGDEVIVVDMRQGWEYHSGHIPGALHMFIQEIPARMNELPKDRDVVFQCWHGNTSMDASAFLIQNGWDAARIFSLSGGMAGWVTAFGPAGLEK
ncbi:MAG: Thiosulfate sulfurtransferase GlpE [Anaerolineae bacterium]|nr:Thiosulfate sulfurtransferase GlpE [Anaerolineae bacterium]